MIIMPSLYPLARFDAHGREIFRSNVTCAPPTVCLAQDVWELSSHEVSADSSIRSEIGRSDRTEQTSGCRRVQPLNDFAELRF